MIDAMEDTLEHDDGQDEGQYDSDAKLTHKWVNAFLARLQGDNKGQQQAFVDMKLWITF